MQAEMVTTGLELPGWRVTRNIGIVRGIVVRSRSLVGNFAGGLQMLFGGNITVYTNLCERTRTDAYEMMCEHADRNGANAILMMLRRQRNLQRRDRGHLLRIGGRGRRGARMNWTIPAGFGLFLAAAAAGLAQLWLKVWDPQTFIKLMITLGVLFAIVLAWHLVVREKRDSERIRDRNKLG